MTATMGHCTTDSPIGPLLVAATDNGLVRLALPTEDHDRVLTSLECAGLAAAGSTTTETGRSLGHLNQASRQLADYFNGQLTVFTVQLDHRLSTGFALAARRAMTTIPYGSTTTYSHLAELAGSPRAVRAAGTACSGNPIPIIVPCHRVLRSDGGLGGYSAGLGTKRYLLDLEAAHG